MKKKGKDRKSGRGEKEFGGIWERPDLSKVKTSIVSVFYDFYYYATVSSSGIQCSFWALFFSLPLRFQGSKGTLSGSIFRTPGHSNIQLLPITIKYSPHQSRLLSSIPYFSSSSIEHEVLTNFNVRRVDKPRHNHLILSLPCLNLGSSGWDLTESAK
ncbi:uncharacterized protein G2W53_028539 [Senna tora]|uniref:Uncharacterized protein n=1 Tax=Senna tora TaxID=362788 RepID=A0A834T2W6_9FABA|nr:uncharacterized protein G2W53_028539 [Senna tora]